MKLSALLVSVVLIGVACKRETPVEPMKSIAPIESAVPAPETPKPVPTTTRTAETETSTAALEATESATQALTREAIVAMFTESCRARPWVLVYDMEGLRRSPLCEAEEFDQNCAPDYFGCWAGREGCRTECGKTCATCDTTCDDACDTCRTGCQDEPDCAARCAEARTECYEGCGAAIENCKNTACTEAMNTCESKGEAEKKKLCGKSCDKYSQCFMAEGASAEKCKARFRKLDARCFEWCLPF